MEDEQKDAEGEIVKDRTHHAEGNHILTNCLDVPAPGIINHFLVHPVGGDRHLREIGHEIGEQNLLGQQWEEREKERCAGHAEHIAEIGACGHEHILQRIGKGRSPFTHPLHQNAKVFFEQHDIGGIFGNVHGAINRDADISRMKRRGIIDAVPHVADDITRLPQGKDNALFLIWFDLGEHFHVNNTIEQCSITHLAELRARKNPCL